ncbi:hypothetical protein DAETH_39980 (plasmid) [Deinococcus aetherius]|uniref:ZU5 domain-containing protein n=1 Tax=Deinococcus aetherius TaxID=200252 RepID=A0ABN6RME0_9DEIO|nr:hypothetical protein [Deinococcus aetherius]BDP44029.1 hypothetical protein DAETH_39980 [Deinococcus aetherius]
MHKKMIGLWLLSAALVACNTPSGGNPLPNPPAPAPTFPAGTPTGEATRTTVGPEGGTVTSADGRLKVSIPAGALSSPTEITVQPITSTAPNGKGSAYRLGPEGTTFKQPVGLSFQYDEAQESSASALVVATQDRQGTWQAKLGTAQDRGANTLTVSTTHFSDWTWAEAYQLDPGQATVKLGQTVKLTLVRCVADETTGEGDDLIAPLTRTCAPYTLTPFTRNWAVNGTAGGSAAVGTVSKDEGDVSSGTYRAPASKPSVNPVAVSVDLVRNETGKNTLRLISSVQVIDGLGPCREVVTGIYTCKYQLTKVNGNSLPFNLPKQSPNQGDARDRLTGGYLQISGTEENLLIGAASYEIRYEFDSKPAGTDRETHRVLNDVGDSLTNLQGTATTFKSISGETYKGLIQADKASADNFPMNTPVFSAPVKLEFAP